jgi:HD superfamily phosphodiesterase
MQNLEIIDRLKVKITELFKDEKTGHDISHLERVFENANGFSL